MQSAPMRLACLACWLPLAGAIAVPKWFTSPAPAEPGWIVGKACMEVENHTQSEALARAVQAALHAAAAQISCHITGLTIDRQADSGPGAKPIECFVSETRVRTDLAIMNHRVFEQGVEKDMAYAMVGIPRLDLLQTYRQRIQGVIEYLPRDFKAAEQVREANPREALRLYERCLAGLDSLGQDLKIYVFLNGWTNDLQSPALTRQEVETRLSDVAGKAPLTDAEIAAQLADPLAPDKPAKGTFFIYPVEYQDTRFVSRYGHTLTEMLAARIMERTGWTRLNQPATHGTTILRGRLLESGDGMLVTLSSMGPDSTTRSQSLFLGAATCQRIGREQIQPANLEKLMIDCIALMQAIQSDQGLRVELKTDQLSDGPVSYRIGDRPKFALRANQACHVRLIYVFADGTPTLLLDNYRIADDKANEWIPVLGDDLEVCEPTGVEQLLIQASETPMPALKTTTRKLDDGYFQDVIEGPLNEAVGATRGIKKKQPDARITETIIQWSIFEK